LNELYVPDIDIMYHMGPINKFYSIGKHWISKVLATKIIVDTEKRLGDFTQPPTKYAFYNKEEISRKYLLERRGKFLDVGAQDGVLMYLLGITENLNRDAKIYSQNKKLFDQKFEYYGMDLNPSNSDKVLSGDICDPNAIFANKYKDFFKGIYSNNVFEHIKKPWIAAENIFKMTKKGGIIITIVPFSQRYHESPGDYFKYTHTGMTSLFESCGEILVLESGYDILGRRNNWQGAGEHNDIVPLDKFGAWRETWHTVSIIKKK
jgi:hypothetical protein